MNETKKWKSRLLSSSIPLEYEAAKILSDLDFGVSFDYTYYRKDGEFKKEFSTDIKGYHLFPINTEQEIDASLTLVAECKYREEGKKWIFLPDINKPESSIFTLGNTIKSLAGFSAIKNETKLVAEFENQFEFALKGIEINLTTGDVYDKDIRHGISQLKFSLPYLVKDQIESNVFGHLEDAKPAYLVTVLITNAELFILNEGFSIERIKKSENLEDLAKQVPYLICHSEIGPDFTEHHKEIFEGFYSACEGVENLLEFESFQETQKDEKYKMYYSPVGKCKELEQSAYYTMRQYYSQHFICSFKHFPEFMSKLLGVLSDVTKQKG